MGNRVKLEVSRFDFTFYIPIEGDPSHYPVAFSFFSVYLTVFAGEDPFA
ncbi:hypothetical protein DFQ01_11065 [Paenibacillus cellulosilyticus]|uniref:Uncharacterized protein n=1 Tax=Paenibacillus cellulosilyticus TaxID=375489 RepID=A0A2V2Z1D5_9BACL|nr:hypothetical protein DFQ01_11065 [Paenibacillus cellulosilyticus]